MKIIILVRVLWTAGAQKIAVREARELAAIGNDVELVFLRGRKLKEYEGILRDVKYEIVSETGNSIFSPIYDYVTRKFLPDRGSESRVDYNLIRAFPKYLKGKEVDYLICHDQFSGLAGYYAHRKYGIDYSVFIHERVTVPRVRFLGRIWQHYEYKVLKNAKAVFAVTEKVAKTVKDLYGISAVPNYPGMDIIRETKFEEKENSIIAVAMWDYGRKPEVYLDMIGNVNDFTLYFAGNFRIKELEDKFVQEVKNRNLEGKVLLKKGLEESELVDLYQRSKFSVRFGFGEYGLGTSVVESIQNCVPVIINSDLGTSDLVRNFSAGLVMDHLEPITVAKFIFKNNNAESYGSLQTNVKKMSKAFSWRKHAEGLLTPVRKGENK